MTFRLQTTYRWKSSKNKMPIKFPKEIRSIDSYELEKVDTKILYTLSKSGNMYFLFDLNEKIENTENILIDEGNVLVDNEKQISVKLTYSFGGGILDLDKINKTFVWRRFGYGLPLKRIEIGKYDIQ